MPNAVTHENFVVDLRRFLKNGLSLFA